jgi:hypothetical protein
LKNDQRVTAQTAAAEYLDKVTVWRAGVAGAKVQIAPLQPALGEQ